MISPFTTTPAMTATVACETVESQAVLDAARSAMPANSVGSFLQPHAIRQLSAKQQPLIPLLMALLDSAQATAKAIEDNALDDSQPITASLANELAAQCRTIADSLANATACPDLATWALPSMSGKELV